MSETSIFDAQSGTSLMFTGIAFSMGYVFRYLLRHNWKDADNTTRVLLHEVIATFEKTVAAYELTIVLGDAGLFWFLFTLALAGIWYSVQWDPSKSSISGHLQNLTDGKISVALVLTQSILEISWGLALYPLYIRPLWTFFSSQPIRAMKLNGVWIADLKINDIGWEYGCWVEFAGSFILQFLSMLINAFFNDRFINIVTGQCLGSAAVGLTLDSAGGYFNPALATILLVGCEGITHLELFMVYWVGSIAGTALAFYSFRRIRRYIIEDELKIE